MVPYFDRNDVQNLLAAIQIHHLHHGYVTRIDPNMGNDHLRNFQCNGHLMVLPIRLGTFLMDMCRFCIHVEFYSPMCMARREWLVVQP